MVGTLNHANKCKANIHSLKKEDERGEHTDNEKHQSTREE